MKKFSVILAALFLLAALAGCGASPERELSSALGLDLTGCDSIDYADKHGGFHNDGETHARLTFSGGAAEALKSAIADSESWEPLPMSEALSAALAQNESTGLPEVENGSYFFLDRSDGSRDVKSLSEFSARYSFNYTVAIYSSDDDTLYFYVLDT